MTEPSPAAGFAPTESFESARVTAAAADDERVVLGTEAGTVEVVEADGRTTVEFDAPIADLAVGSRVYALAGETVAAVSAAGTRVWSVQLPEAEKLAALPEADVLGVVTDRDDLLGFDGETGTRRFDAPRPHADVTDDPGFFGTDGAFVLVAWSFLAVRNADGSERFDRNFDGAIESAGIVDGTIVVSLKDERVVGVDAETGEQQWERELAVTDLPDRGEDGLLFTAEGQLVSLAADGTYAPVSDLPGGDVYPTSDGDLFCAVADGTVAVYRSAGDPASALEVAVGDGELVARRAVDVTVRNAGDAPVSTTLGASGDGVAIDAPDLPVDLDPGESVTRSLPIESVSADETAAVAVEADGDRLTSVTLPVGDDTAGALGATAELDAVIDGTAAFAVAVRNDGDVPADPTVSPGDVALGPVAPGESATATVDVAFDPGRTVPISVRSEAAGTGDDLAVEASIPDRACDVAVEATDEGFVDVRVENRSSARLEDDLAVEGDCFDGRVERRVELPPRGSLVLALRPIAPEKSATATVEATLVGLGTSASTQCEAGRSGAPDRSRGTGDGSGRPGTAATVPERETGLATADASRSATGPVLAADRRVKPSEPERTRGVLERLSVANEGGETAEEVRADLPDETVAVGALRPGESATFERRHAFLEAGTTALPAGRVTAANAPETGIDERELTVEPAELAVEADFDPGDGCRVRVSLTNRRGVACDVPRIGVKEFGVWSADLRIPPGETVEWTRQIDAPELTDAVVEIAVEYAFDDRESKRWQTLGYVPDSGDGDDETLAASVGEGTRVSGGYGSVALVVENESDEPVSDVSVEATGEAVSDLMYAGRESVDRLAPGETFTHYVDVETEGPEAAVSVALSTGDETEELTLRGPVPVDEDDWSEETLADWRVERADDGETGDARSDRVTSGFEEA